MMKKILAVTLIAASVFSMCACTKKDIVGADAGETSEELKVISTTLTEEQYGIGVDKDKPELLAQVNAFLAESRKSGELDEIIDRYLEGGEPKLVTSAELDKDKDQLVVVSTLDFEPFEYGEIGKYYGIDMEIIERLADYLDKELVIINSSFETMFLSVKQHKCDICIGGITITDERKQLVDFSEPYFITGLAIAVPVDNTEFDNVKNVTDMEMILKSKSEDETIGVENLTTAQAYCKGEDGYEGLGMTVKGYRDLEAAIIGLEDGECQYVLGDQVPVEMFVNRTNGKEQAR
ncbi:MAG: transporter substrate-binding domain-containing protein [Lachnospiraceae bacterium]|nr:transporter substrate-binding domain-containing protein [Lachnospiraceae bacterium]